MHVAAGRKDCRRPNEIAADNRSDETSVKRPQQRRSFVVLGEQPINARQFIKSFAGFLRLRGA